MGSSCGSSQKFSTPKPTSAFSSLTNFNGNPLSMQKRFKSAISCIPKAQESDSNSDASNSDENDDKASCEDERFVGSIKLLPSKLGQTSFVFEVKRKSSVDIENEPSKTKPCSTANQIIQKTQEVSRVTTIVQDRKVNECQKPIKQTQIVAKSEPIISTFNNKSKLASFDSAPQLSTMQTPEWGGNNSGRSIKAESNNIQSSIKKLQLLAKQNKISVSNKAPQAPRPPAKKQNNNYEV